MWLLRGTLVASELRHPQGWPALSGPVLPSPPPPPHAPAPSLQLPESTSLTKPLPQSLLWGTQTETPDHLRALFRVPSSPEENHSPCRTALWLQNQEVRQSQDRVCLIYPGTPGALARRQHPLSKLLVEQIPAIHLLSMHQEGQEATRSH